MSTQPNYKVSDAIKRTKDWYINAIDWLISKSISDNNKRQTFEAQRVANGIIDTNEFKNTIQPFANVGEEIKNLPGTIRNIDFVTNIREKNIGEYISLPYKYFVTVENPDLIMKRDSLVSQMVFKEVQSLLATYVEQLQSGQQPQQIDPAVIKDKADKLAQEFFDNKVIEAQHILDFINHFNNFYFQRIQAFNDWWCTTEFYTYRYIQNGELYKEVFDVASSYLIENNADFNEDKEGFMYKQRITFQEFEQHYSDRLTKDEQDYLKTISYNAGMGGYTVPINILYERGNLDGLTNYTTGNTNNYLLGGETMDLYRLFFVAQAPVYELTYTDEMNRIQTTHVDSKYELNKANGDIEINKIWIPKVYEAFRFGGENVGVYIAPQPLEVQRYDKNANTVKLPIGGKKGLLKGLNMNPIPLRIKPYVIVDRILLLQIERTIAKYRSDLRIIPQSILNPDKAGTALEKYQHILADDTLIWDDTEVDINLIREGLRSIAGPNIAQYISTLWDLRIRNKNDALEVANMNQERLGQASSNQPLGTTENNLAYARLGSILMITIFNAALERDHIADLEYSKYAYINGKQATYFDKATEEYVELNIDPIENFYNRMGVSVSNSQLDSDIMDQFKRQAFSASQNGDMDMAAVAITATSPKEIAKTLTAMGEAKRTFEQQAKQQELAILQEKNDLVKNQMALADSMNKEDNATDIQVAQISASGKVQSSSISSHK
jgi:hypothetical protein